MCVLEKAYAKVHGCYEALVDGEVDYGLRDITGGIPKEFDLTEGSEDSKWFSEGDGWRWFASMAMKHDVLLGAAITVDGVEAEKEAGHGLLFNHAYSVLQISTAVEGKTLIEMRNPWGKELTLTLTLTLILILTRIHAGRVNG